MKLYQADCFLIQPTKQGIPVFEIPSLDDEPKNAHLSYDGKDKAVLIRNSENSLLLNYINPQAQKILSKAQKAFMIEFDLKTEQLKRSYYVQIKQEPISL